MPEICLHSSCVPYRRRTQLHFYVIHSRPVPLRRFAHVPKSSIRMCPPKCNRHRVNLVEEITQSLQCFVYALLRIGRMCGPCDWWGALVRSSSAADKSRCGGSATLNDSKPKQRYLSAKAVSARRKHNKKNAYAYIRSAELLIISDTRTFAKYVYMLYIWPTNTNERLYPYCMYCMLLVVCVLCMG